MVLADIYPAGESPIAGIGSDALGAAVEQRGARVERIAAPQDALSAIDRVVEDRDLLLIMGAGDIGALGGLLKEAYA